MSAWVERPVKSTSDVDDIARFYRSERATAARCITKRRDRCDQGPVGGSYRAGCGCAGTRLAPCGSGIDVGPFLTAFVD